MQHAALLLYNSTHAWAQLWAPMGTDGHRSFTCGVRQRAVPSSRITSNTRRKKVFLQHMSASKTATSSVAGIAARPSLCPLYMTLQRVLFRLPDLPLISPAPRVRPDTYLHRMGACVSTGWCQRPLLSPGWSSCYQPEAQPSRRCPHVMAVSGSTESGGSQQPVQYVGRPRFTLLQASSTSEHSHDTQMRHASHIGLLLWIRAIITEVDGPSTPRWQGCIQHSLQSRTQHTQGLLQHTQHSTTQPGGSDLQDGPKAQVEGDSAVAFIM